MRSGERRSGAALALLGAGSILAALGSAGCGSSSSNGNMARIRAVDVATNASTADVLVNGGTTGGDLSFGQVTSYNYLSQGVSTFSYTTTASLPSGITNPPSATLQLNNGSFYTAYLIGRSDVQGSVDPRFLQTVVAGDKGAAANYSAAIPYADPPSGQANVRILNAAADARSVDVLVNGARVFSSVAYPTFPTATPAGSTTGPATIPVTPYQAIAAGTLSVQINAAGSATVLVPATSVSVSSGNAYTIVVTEPATTPTYGLITETDQP